MTERHRGDPTRRSGSKAATNVATKEIKREVRGLIEGLEYRVHSGPPIREAEIQSVRGLLQQHEFSPASDYFNRLVQVQNRLQSRPPGPALPQGKRDYSGEAAGQWMQVQSAYDHVILSTCYEGQFNGGRGRVKISHRFNQEGRIDFVELKFLRSLHACLNGELRKLIAVRGYQTIAKGWHAAEAFVLEVLPRELVFLYEDIFRCPRNDVLAWLVNIGHRMVDDLLKELKAGRVNGEGPRHARNPDQLCLSALLSDAVAPPVLTRAAALECVVESEDAKIVVVRYLSK